MDDQQLRQTIAELLGYQRIELLEKHEIQWVGSSIKAAWAIALSPSEGWLYVPNWSVDVNAALELVSITNFALTRVDHQTWRAEFDDVRADDASPARAICKAWLLWKQE